MMATIVVWERKKERKKKEDVSILGANRASVSLKVVEIMNCYFCRSIQTCSLLTAHLLFFPSNHMYILAPTGNIKEGLLQHDGYSSHRNYIITSRNKYDVSSVTNRELNSELSVGGLNSCLNMERG
jgi:hypothetical protein